MTAARAVSSTWFRAVACACLLASSGSSRVARAEEGGESARRAPALAFGAAVVPGVLVHGSGHYVAGERRTARRLLALQGIGLGVAATGGLALGLTGASRWVSGPAIGLAATGITTFGLTWLADLYGVAGGARRHAKPRLSLPRLVFRAGYAYVRDPEFDYESFAVAGGEASWRSFRAAIDTWIALDDDNQRYRAVAARRLGGVGARRSPVDGSYVEVGAAASEHRFGDDAFAVESVELFGAGRLDLVRVGPTLDGSFAQFLGGVQVEHIRYGGVGGGDFNTQLLLRAGYGLYFGNPGGAHGELELYYDHRRDGFVGGLALERGGGFIGHFGVASFVSLASGWGLVGAFEVGAANVLHVGVRRELGEVSR